MIIGLGTHSLANSELDLLDSLGVKHIRHTLYAHQPVDQPAIANAISRGFKLLLVVHGVEHLRLYDWGLWMIDTCMLLPEVEAWQIGNEVPFFGDFATHANYHITAHEIIKDLTGALVISMDLSDETRRDHLKHLSYDAYAVHIYEYPNAPQIARLARDLQGETWITELGLNDSQIPEDHAAGSGGWENVQATEWRRGFENAHAFNYARAYAYQLRTNETTEHHGIIRADGSLRPTADVIKEFSHV